MCCFTFDRCKLISYISRENAGKRLRKKLPSPRVASPLNFMRALVYFVRPIATSKIKGFQQSTEISKFHVLLRLHTGRINLILLKLFLAAWLLFSQLNVYTCRKLIIIINFAHLRSAAPAKRAPEASFGKYLFGEGN